MLVEYFAVTFYVRISRDEIRVRNIRSKAEMVVRANVPFSTGRLLVGQFLSARDTLRLAMSRISRGSFWRPAPAILMHPLDMTEGGLSEVEVRVLRELARSAGAFRVTIWTGPQLSDLQVEARMSPRGKR